MKPLRDCHIRMFRIKKYCTFCLKHFEAIKIQILYSNLITKHFSAALYKANKESSQDDLYILTAFYIWKIYFTNNSVIVTLIEL